MWKVEICEILREANQNSRLMQPRDYNHTHLEMICFPSVNLDMGEEKCYSFPPEHDTSCSRGSPRGGGGGRGGAGWEGGGGGGERSSLLPDLMTGIARRFDR